MNNFTKGYNKLNDCIYEHHPSSEKALFRDVLMDYISKKESDNPEEDNVRIEGIEIGVLNGETSGFLLNIHPAIHLIGIDPLIPDSMEKSLIGSMQKINENTKSCQDRFEFIHNFSFEVSQNFENNFYDFVFIDGDHTFDAVKVDFETYYPKVKKGGYIFFHDSRMNRGGAQFHVGSSKFVDKVIASDKRVSLIAEAFSLTCFIKLGD